MVNWRSKHSTKRKNIVFVLSLFIAPAFSGIPAMYGQASSPDNFSIVFENNFEDNQLGNYSHADYISDWNLPATSTLHEKEIVTILLENDSIHNKFMRGYYPKGTYLPQNHGFLWFSRLANPCNELYFSYDVRFKPGFEWVMGGKLPGITGGKVVTGIRPGSTDGFSARMVWKEEGKLVFYVYHQDQRIKYGSTYFWGDFKFKTGQWYNLTLRLVLNTFKDNVAQSDGVLEGFVDGKLIFQKTDIKFRSLERIKIDNIYICSFFGGSSDKWAATRNEWTDTDNYVAFTYSDKITNVPRDHEVSSWSKALLHPYYNFSTLK